MKLTEHFTLEEFLSSYSAQKRGIDNTPTNEYKENLKKLAVDVMEPIRQAYGAPIIISSGYRCDKLNKAIGGVSNSDHRFGCACDFHSKSDKLSDNKKLYDVIIKMVKDGKLKCRQVIWEYGNKKSGPDWIHISINNKYNSYKNNQIVYIGC